MNVKEYLYKFRTENHFTQECMAQMVGVSQTTYSNWETGKGEPNIKKLPKISKLVGLSLVDLIPSDLQIEVKSPSRPEENFSVNATDFYKSLLELKDTVINSKDETIKSQKKYIESLEEQILKLKEDFS